MWLTDTSLLVTRVYVFNRGEDTMTMCLTEVLRHTWTDLLRFAESLSSHRVNWPPETFLSFLFYYYTAFALDVRFVRDLSSEATHYFLNETFEHTMSDI